jgi:hypothetical protein
MLHSRGVRSGAPILLLAAVSIAPSFASTAPYPPSRLITGVQWDFSDITTLRKARGSDIWPLTWGPDDALYTAWGDGGGFDGDSNSVGRVSLGFARLTGDPLASDPQSFEGQNLWGDARDGYALSAATFGGKVGSLICVNGILYGLGGLWTSANSVDPVATSGAGPLQKLIWSSDLGRSWQIAPWNRRFGFEQFLNFGRNNALALDDNVYVYYLHDDDARNVFLKRVASGKLTADPATGTYQYLSGVDAANQPLWSALESDAVPVFHDVNNVDGWDAVYDAGIGRFLVSAGHDASGRDEDASAGQVGLFEAPQPWGPWRTVGYYDNWGNLGPSSVGDYLGLSFPGKWMSADGSVLWGVFSSLHDYDSFNLVRATLALATDAPQITAPAPGVVLAPGEVVTARGSGSQLSWSVALLHGAAVASATGTSISFIVPEVSVGDSVLRVTLNGSGSSVYRDYAVQGPLTAALSGAWPFNEGSGSSAADSSGHGDTGTLVNGPTWTRGEAGAALAFDGRRSAVLVPAAATLADLYRRGLTVAAWVRPAGPQSSGRILDKDGNDFGWFLKVEGDSLEFTGDQFELAAASRGATTPLRAGVWQHVAATWDGSPSSSHIHLYVDGTPADGSGTDGAGAAGDDAAIPLTIGNRAADLARGFSGAIDEVRVFDRVLSAGEVTALFEGAAQLAP